MMKWMRLVLVLVRMGLEVGEVLRLVVIGGRGCWIRILLLTLTRTMMTKRRKKKGLRRMVTMKRVKPQHYGKTKVMPRTMSPTT